MPPLRRGATRHHVDVAVEDERLAAARPPQQSDAVLATGDLTEDVCLGAGLCEQPLDHPADPPLAADVLVEVDAGVCRRHARDPDRSGERLDKLVLQAVDDGADVAF